MPDANLRGTTQDIYWAAFWRGFRKGAIQAAAIFAVPAAAICVTFGGNAIGRLGGLLFFGSMALFGIIGWREEWWR